jgi:mannose-1-phosphate guanylyltransferase
MHARRRAERSIPPLQVLYSLTHGHQQFYLPDLEDCPSQRVVQPSNRGTAPGIVSGLLRIAQTDEQATVAVLPSDHRFSDEAVFAKHLKSAFEIAEQERRSIILLGAPADSPETEYGWIQPGGALRGSEIFHVERYHEKPSLQLAQSLLEGNSLWNTFVMVGSVWAFLEAVRSTIPELLDAFRAVSPSARNHVEVEIPDFLYEQIPHSDFSRQVLSAATERLLVSRLGPVGWSDLGDPNRALVVLSKSGTEPEWAQEWRQSPGALQVASSVVASAP